LGTLETLARAKRRIPDDIAVVGFDDTEWAPLITPPLTTVAQPTYDLGLETARLLLSRVEGYTGGAREVVLSPELRVRASSLPRRRRAGGAAQRPERPGAGRRGAPAGGR
ncbi:MAG TPA: substrate-binding domain-containing protein, partial [Acidimicrobiales bacterium]|nr:substrate-binding domain-containing protein [Acidimicrobiales bacterium]